MAIIGILIYALSYGVGYAVGYFSPEGPWTPYLPLLVTYHVFLISLLVVFHINDEQKVGMSMSLPMTVISHAAFLGALIGVVFMRQYVPFFSLVRYVLPGLAPFEAKWLFEGRKKTNLIVEPAHLPPGTTEDYLQFTEYMGQKNRRYARAGRSLQDEFVAWNADRAKRRAIEEAEPSGTKSPTLE